MNERVNFLRNENIQRGSITNDDSSNKYIKNMKRRQTTTNIPFFAGVRTREESFFKIQKRKIIKIQKKKLCFSLKLRLYATFWTLISLQAWE